MANELVVQIVGIFVIATILLFGVVLYKRRQDGARSESSPRIPQSHATAELKTTPKTAPAAVPRIPVEIQTANPLPTPASELAAVNVPRSSPPPPVVSTPANFPTPPAAPFTLQMSPLNQEQRNERILADISENIRKSLIKPLPAYSPLQNPESPRETEYVRVKKQIITPHGQVRFSILKDSIATNMMAVFRRASLDWKTPDDLIGFLPPYLQPEAEVVNDQVLLIGTPGHNEKLAIPIRSFDAESTFRDCFDFVTDVRSATNSPAVLLASDTELSIVSRGVIAQPVFTDREGRTERRFLGEKAPEALQAAHL